MPAICLGSCDATVLSILGDTRSDYFLYHVGLVVPESPDDRERSSEQARARVRLNAGDIVAVYEMAPPLHAGTGTNPPRGRMRAHTLGWIDDLSGDERQGMIAWIKDVRTYSGTAGKRAYVVHPPFLAPDRETTAGRTPRTKYWRFSCVGFVLGCYEFGAQIRLLAADDSTLPLVELDTVRSVYEPRMADLLVHDARTGGHRFGLEGPPPWPIVLPGYVFHAMNRESDEIRMQPYQPSQHDAEFRPADSVM